MKQELELELIQSHMAQKPMLRGEVGARVRVIRETRACDLPRQVWRVGEGADCDSASMFASIISQATTARCDHSCALVTLRVPRQPPVRARVGVPAGCADGCPPQLKAVINARVLHITRYRRRPGLDAHSDDRGVGTTSHSARGRPVGLA